MTAPAKRRGYTGNVYMNTQTPGTDGTPQTFVQIESAMDIKLGDAWDTFVASNRASPVKKFLPAQLDWSIEFDVIWDETDTDLVALRDAHNAGTVVALVALPGASDESGAIGPYADWLISEFGKDMPLSDGQKINVKCLPHANCRFEPQYLEIS